MPLCHIFVAVANEKLQVPHRQTRYQGEHMSHSWSALIHFFPPSQRKIPSESPSQIIICKQTYFTEERFELRFASDSLPLCHGHLTRQPDNPN